jgi:hypothetical protein
MRSKLRVGRHRQRHVYLQYEDEPRDTDPEIAFFETEDGALDYVRIMNDLPEEQFMDLCSFWTR